MKNKLLNSIIFVIGYVLSPMTWWNDAFINIPIAYFLASFTKHLAKTDFLWSFIFYYWLSNIVGVFMMFIAGRSVINEKKAKTKKFAIIFDIVFYSLLIGVLVYFNILKPIPLFSP